MNDCYTIKELYNDSGMFDEVIDCTYVILCCGPNPEREYDVRKQLSLFQPCRTIKLLYNYGYTCKLKKLRKKQTDHDLLDALLYIFNDAAQYNRILVLEDDFQIDGRILDPIHHKEVTKYLKNNDVDVYGIGNDGIPYISDMFAIHQRMTYMTWAHAMFYSKSYRSNVLAYANKQTKLSLGKNWATDRIWYDLPNITVYRYHKPLCYQLFTRTENSTNWVQR